MEVKTFKEMGKKQFFIGNKDIADEMGSFWTNELVLLHGASKNGKSMYTMSIANENGKLGTKVAYLSLEMDKETLKMQQSCIRAGIDRKDFENETYSQYQRDNYMHYFRSFEDNFKLFDEVDFGNLNTLDNVASKIQELYLTQGIELFIIDSLKLIKGKKGSQNDWEMECIMKFKELKNKLPICIVLIHHNNKAGDIFSGAQDLENFSDRRIMIKKELDDMANGTTIFNQTRITIYKERLGKEMEFLFNFDKGKLIFLPQGGQA